MLRAGFFLTGLVAFAWFFRLITYEPRLFGELEFIYITFLAAVAVIVIWVSIAIASAIETSRRLREEMRKEGWPGRPDA